MKRRKVDFACLCKEEEKREGESRVRETKKTKMEISILRILWGVRTKGS